MPDMKKDGLAPPPSARTWTRIDDYVANMRGFGSASRRRRRLEPRTEPENPRFMLSTFPFLALIAIFGVMTVIILVAAWPGREHPVHERTAAHEVGTAAKGWFQEAKREMR